MLRDGEKFLSKLPKEKQMDCYFTIPVNYTFNKPCRLSKSQLDIYFNEKNGKKTAYNNPFKIEFDDFSAKDIKDAIEKLFTKLPILSAHIIHEDNEILFDFDANPSINIGAVEDDDSFVNPFELEENLSKFLIVEHDKSTFLYADFHSLIFDDESLEIILNRLMNILNDKDNDSVDDSILRHISFEEHITDSDYRDNAEKFYEFMLSNQEDVNELLPSVNGSDNDYEYVDSFDIDYDSLTSFIKSNSIDETRLFTSVFAYALSRFSGSSKVLFDYVENYRNHIDLSDSVGRFAISSPIMVDCANQKINQYLTDTADLIDTILEFNLYPSHSLADDLNTNISFQHTSCISHNYEGIANVEKLSHDLSSDLSFYICNNEDNTLKIRVLYSDKFSKEPVERFVESYKLILNGIAEADLLSDINYTPLSDLTALDNYNNTQRDLDYDDLLEAFNDHLSRYPNDKMVSYGNESYTHAQGAFIANRIANELTEMGVAGKDCVAFLTERNELYIFSALSILSIGATYVPLDHAHPDERLQFILEDTSSKVVIVSDETYERAERLAENAIILNITDIVKNDVGTLSSLPTANEDLACILYTSGTTGLPKGVKVTRKSLLNVSAMYSDTYNLSNDDVYGLYSAIGFDGGSLAIAASLYSGACLSIVPEDIKLNIKKLNEYFIDQGISHTMITTQVGKLFMQTVEDTSLDVLLVGGEKLGDFESPENYLLVDGFGPTECFAFISAIKNSDKLDSSSVGLLNYNTKAYVLDDEFRRVPIGAVGELYLAGYQIAEGYLNREEENLKSFIENPFEDDEAYSRLYRTGDMIRLLPDGSLGVVGRRDSQVKIRGNRVELSEIESIIREMNYIDDVTVQTVIHDNNHELVAYVVLDGEHDDFTKAIQDYVGKHSPEYMIPSFVIRLDSIPLTVNGKVDTNALPEIDFSRLRAEYVAPTNNEERKIVEAFEEVFNQEKISVLDDFVFLGGDSLTAIKLLSLIGDYNISSADILSLKTPKTIAENIVKTNFDLDLYSVESGCPLNESQLNVYLDIVTNDKVNSYLIPISMSISKDYSIDDITSALNTIFEVHPILEMCISEDYEVPYLIKAGKPDVIIKTDADKDYISNFLSKHIELKHDLCRFLIVENDGEYMLFAVFHHLIFDALSFKAFKENLLAILEGNDLNVDKSFLEISAYSKQIQETAEFNEAKEFYDSMLAETMDTNVLLDDVAADGPGIYFTEMNIDISEFSSENKVSENVLFTSAFAYTLSKFIGSDNVLFNIIENGRSRFNNFSSIGMFVTTLPLLINCKNQKIDSYMNHVSEFVYNVMKYNYYPFRVLANEYDIDSSIYFQYVPKWINVNDSIEYNIEEFMNETVEESDDVIGDFIANIIQSNDGYKIYIKYSDKYSRSFIERFVESYKLILEGLTNCESLNEIDYISDSDLELLDKYNKTEHDLEYVDILDAFNNNLVKYPDNVLVWFNGVSYTYGEGAFIANKIAKQLIDLGVNHQDRVSFLVERSELYMFCVLGIMSMGGVYVPLDDKHPDERVKFVLEDTSSRVVIVSDNTYERVNKLANDNIILLNISDILKEDIDFLSSLPVVYGELACILYTSGTTGVPKGVKTTRKSIINFSEFYVRKYSLSEEDIFALYASIGFDVSMEAIFASIYAGACLNIIPDDIKLDMKSLNEYFINQKVTYTHLPAQVAKIFIAQNNDSSLKVLCTGGEKLGEIEKEVKYRFVDSYGPTETFVDVTSIDVNSKIDVSSIGYLFNNTKAYILDDEFRRVPIGAVGELYLSGYQIADGYLNREDETKKAFNENPFDSGDYNVMYRTGDMVRLLPDGSLGIVGRRDGQVKIRGNRVELLEVESIIRNIDAVDDVTVQTVKHDNNHELVAYVVSDGTDEHTVEEKIHNHILKSKPEYMVPSFIVFLDKIPLTVNGKVDRRSLPDVDFDKLHVDYVAPTNDVENAIIEAFESVFNLEKISLFDDFTRLGGDSISAIRVISHLQKNSLSCTARDILNYKTPYLIAQNIELFDDNIIYDAVEGEVEMLPIQHYFFDQHNTNEYSQQFILKSNEIIDLDILQKALDELANVHDMLRASYRFDENKKPIQEILPLNTRICEVNEHEIDKPNLNQAFNQIFIDSIRSLDIQNKLIDVSLIHYDDADYVLFIIHHLIIDGVSWNVLLVDLTHIYYCLKNGKDLDILRPYPFKMWVDDVKELVSNISPEEKQHWIEVNSLLDDSDIRGKTNLYSFNVENSYDVDNLLMLSEEEYWSFAIARAYKKTFAKDVIFNHESYGREDTIANLNRTIGWFTTQYPIPVEISGNDDYVSLISDVYKLKTAFKEVANLGLNYSSLIYITKELEYKHCPITFNFLSSEFVFENMLFKSINHYLSDNEIIIDAYDAEFHGMSLNVSRVDDMYLVSGAYAEDTYISKQYSTFVENIKEELKFLSEYKIEDNIVCCLSESQIGVYLDEKVQDKGVAYSTSRIFECNLDKSIDDIKEAIYSLIDKHPILKGRIVENGDDPLLVCDSFPSVDVISTEDYDSLIKPFNLDESLARFVIVDKPESRVIFYDIHHVICDATAHTVINRELNEALNNDLDEKIDLGFVYACYDSFESKFLPNYESAHEFFCDIFAEVDEIPPLLDDIDGEKGRVCLPIHGIREKVESFTLKNGITAGNLFNAVFAYTYSRFTGGDKVYYNYTEHGRHNDYSQDAVGMFVRTIPIVVDCRNRAVSDYVGDVSDLILDSMSNSIYPFRLLAREFDLNNKVIFEYNSDLNDMFDIGEDIVRMDVADGVAEFLCVVNNLEDGYVVSVDHLENFSQDTAERFANAFKEILIQFIDKKELGDIDYISNRDIKLLDEYNRTETSFEYDDILEAFNDNLSEHENDILVGYENVRYTHGEGAFIASEIANRLREMKVDSQDFVALFVPRSEWFLLASMSVLSMGGIYVPIETTYPEDRIVLMLEDSNSKVVVVSDETEQRILKIILDNDLDIDVLNVSAIVDGDIGSLNHLKTSEVDGDYGACVLYTSGTTGVPKGSLTTRRAINNFVSWYVEETSFTSDDVYGMHCSYVFDIHTAALFAPVITGGSLYIVPEDIRLDLKALNDYYVEHNCTHTYITSQVGKLFAESRMETTIKLLCFGGMKLGELNAPDSIGPFETYGPSENLAVSTSIFANERMHSSSIGQFISNVKGYVLDGNHRRVPLGAVGELYLAGHQLTPGYLNREEANAESFFDNPFDDEKGYERIYNTGDIVRVLPDGTLGIIGRRDGQVKIRGNRVELPEVETVIRNMDYVDDVTVQTITNKGNNELVAYVVVSQGIDKENARDIVCDYVSEHKPDYMVPSYVISLDTIPLNVNGKVDKRALPEVDLESLHAEYVAPGNENENIVVEAFENVFNQDRISVYDDFIHLGGDSLTAIKLVSYLSDYNITAANILNLKTPRAIAKIIRQTDLDLDIYTLESGCPLNESQLNVYLDIIANNKIDSYLIPIHITLTNDYALDELSDALKTICEAHPILRMRISEEYEVPYLVKGSDPLISIESDIDDEIIRKFITEPFNLNERLCRFMIAENDGEYNLFGVFHHLIFDGLSSSVLEHDLFEILNGKSLDIDDSFLKVSAFTQQIQDSEEYRDADKFFEAMLVDSNEVNVLLDCVDADGAGNYSIDLDLNIEDFFKKYDVSENVLFTGVFAYTLSRFIGDNEVIFNIVENGRDRFNNFNSIGMYVNTLPLLVDCKNQDVKAFLDYMSDLVYNVMGYNYYPFRLLAKKYDVNSDIMFQYMPDWFVKQEVSFSENTFDRIIKEEMVSEMDDLISDLSVDVIQKGTDYSLNIMYCDKYSRDMIKRFAESFKLILHGIIEADKLSEINYISPSDIELINSYNKTERDLKYSDVLDAFNENLEKHPDNALVSYMDRSYSYSEGAFLANKIAEKLKSLGVEAQDNVAFLVERSELYMFPVLGILSIGAVYVPLDDKHPDERIQFMLEDTDSKVVIVSDETYERVKSLTNDLTLLNISEMIDEGIGRLSTLPAVYDDLACILYTSGTTGIPKGVKITRKSIINLSEFYIREYELTHDNVYALVASIGFDVAMKAIFPSICAGACLAVVPTELRLNMNAMNDYFIEHDVTHTEITTQVAKLFISQISETSLKVLTTGGEKLGDSEINLDYRFVDSYGPTEACVDVTCIDVDEKIDFSSVGYLMDNIKAYVLDDEFRRIPIGGVGELYLTGNQIADGYLNREEETVKAFIDNPFDDDYPILYRTGDIVRLLPDGSIGIVGRRDSQVKIRGNRVELSEVELIIREMDCIDDVTVQTVKNGANNELAAYVTLSKDMDDNNIRNDVREHVGNRKPDYMVPTYVVTLDEIPLTVNGKVNKQALPKVDKGDLQGEYVAPENETEEFFAECFEKILGIDKIGATDNFFEMGGDSLLVVKIIIESINNGYSISYGDVFDNPTPRLLSKAISSDDYTAKTDEDEYDYTLINDLLKRNNIDSFAEGDNAESLGNVLLLGATGFLGIHILNDLLENEDSTICCLIRAEDNSQAEDRLKSLYEFYFDDDISKFENRLHIIAGDMVLRDDFEKIMAYEIDTIINSAANVKHYAQGSELKTVNLYGAMNALEFAKVKDARFIQISTVSVAGKRVNNVPGKGTKLLENELFIGQEIDNKYVESKFLAERAVLESAVHDGVDVKIMRVGNLMARSYDGRFQMNYDTNAFMNTLKSFVTIGKIPDSISQESTDLSQIDLTAKYIIALSKTPKDCTVFHLFNNNEIPISYIVDVFNDSEFGIEECDDNTFGQYLNEVLKDKSKQDGIFGLMTLSNNSENESESILADCSYTSEVLSRLGLKWPEITHEYISKFIETLDKLNYFKD